MNKTYGLAVALLTATAMLLSAAGEQDSEMAADSDGGPQYGGTLTAVSAAFVIGPESPDPADGQGHSTLFLSLIQERPRIGDHEKYGPKGTGEYPFTLVGPMPDKYARGLLLESWDITPEQFTWNLRKGVMWAADNVDYMENREMVAEDVVADLEYYRESPAGARFKGVSGDITATDSHTVVIEFTDLDIGMLDILTLGGTTAISPPEMEAAGMDKWENQVGTGPFMFGGYEIDSHMTYERNPNYWDHTTIDGQQYQLPFVDKVIVPIIADEASMVAALRTGKADMASSVFAVHWQTLDETAPELNSHRFPISFGSTAYLKTTEPPFDNRDVRRAMMVGTDLTGFQKLRQAGDLELPTHWFPVDPIMPSYTPMDELPEETRMLYDYNPEKAKQMLADAGYPNGFTIDYTTLGWPEFMTDGALLKDQWEKIGVTVNLQGFEAAVWSGHARDRTYTGSVRQGHCGGCPVTTLPRFTTGHTRNYTDWSDPKFDAMVEELVKELDPAKRNEMIKAASIYLLNEVIAVPQAVKVQGRFWWPWINNYYGETYIASTNTWLEPSAWVWIDQNMKKEMGY